MSKKVLQRKPAQEFIRLSRSNGKTDQDIYDEMSPIYYDKKSIALLISGTVKAENKNKYKRLNQILIGLLGLSIFFKILIVISLSIQTGQFWMLLFILIAPLLTIYFIYSISQYNVESYKLLAILVIADFFQTIPKLGSGIDILFNLVVTIAVAALSLYLKSQLFPGYNPKQLVKDDKGEYILNEVSYY